MQLILTLTEDSKYLNRELTNCNIHVRSKFVSWRRAKARKFWRKSQQSRGCRNLLFECFLSSMYFRSSTFQNAIWKQEKYAKIKKGRTRNGAIEIFYFIPRRVLLAKIDEKEIHRFLSSCIPCELFILRRRGNKCQRRARIFTSAHARLKETNFIPGYFLHLLVARTPMFVRTQLTSWNIRMHLFVGSPGYHGSSENIWCVTLSCDFSRCSLSVYQVLACEQHAKINI